MAEGASHDFLFYSGDLDIHSATFDLVGDEHHHGARVLRLRRGDVVYVTNGRGLIADCVVEGIEKHMTRLRVAERSVERPSGPRVTLALGCVKKDAFEQAVKQCTELGMDCCVPFSSAKSHLRDYGPGFLDRVRRVALAAMKQSFRATLPEIEPVMGFEDILERLRGQGRTIVGDSGGGRLTSPAAEQAVTIVVGPEGGFTPGERDALRALGGEFVAVSANRLRSETAAAALTLLVRAPDRG